MNKELIPVRAVLFEEQDWLSRRSHTRSRTRCLDLHQGDKAVHLGLLRSEFGQDTSETQRILAEGRPQPVVTGGSRIALVEYQVDDLKNRRQTGS